MDNSIKLKNETREGFSICPLCGRTIHAGREDIAVVDYETGTFAIHEDCELWRDDEH